MSEHRKLDRQQFTDALRELAARSVRSIANRDAAGRVARTFGFAFLGVLVPGALGWLHALTEWASSEGQSPFPDAMSLAYLGVSAIVAGAVALVNAAGIWLENMTGKAVLRPNTKA